MWKAEDIPLNTLETIQARCKFSASLLTIRLQVLYSTERQTHIGQESKTVSANDMIQYAEVNTKESTK